MNNGVIGQRDQEVGGKVMFETQSGPGGLSIGNPAPQDVPLVLCQSSTRGQQCPSMLGLSSRDAFHLGC